ncbi:MAG: S-layer homology domain-containing protein, partial [Oscillospiraceae bacterium]|nr:S-layer homology domain-containing protein [Oscillospiraceae bacterium]
VSLSPTSLKMDTYSSQWINLSVSPSKASYDVEWKSSNTNIVSLNGSGSTVTVISGGRTGSATVTATVRDANGNSHSATCNVTVSEDRGSYIYNPTLTVTMGSDYYGTSTSTSMSNQFHSYFGYYLGDDASITFSSTGNKRYGVQRLANGRAISANTTYTFRDWILAYFEPVAAGTFELPYTITYRGYTMTGVFTIYIRGAGVSASIDPTSMRMSTNSSQYVDLDITGRYNRITWSSSNTRIVTVSGNDTRATVYSGSTTGSATVSATIIDTNGVSVVKNCSINVSGSDRTYNPSVSTTLGVPYTGTGTSDAMKSQFNSLFGISLNENNTTIRFSSVGDNRIAVLRMADGSAARANTNYSFAQYRAMYTAPVSAGNFSFPYTLTYNNNTLSGTVTVAITNGSVNAALSLSSTAPYSFSTASANGSTGATILKSAIDNSVGSSWSYIRFSVFSDLNGTLYQNASQSGLTTSANINASALNNLYYVPASGGAFTARFTVYNSNGNTLGTGALTIAVASSFSDVPTGAYYYNAVSWAVASGVTAGTNVALNTFEPNTIVTRGDAVTFLWRVMGKPEPHSASNPFTDVSSADYYYKPILWAVENGITLGKEPTRFAPADPVTKIQMLSFIYRARGGYVNVATWESDTVNWANNQNMLSGIPTAFAGADSCPRSDVVYYLYRDSQMRA